MQYFARLLTSVQEDLSPDKTSNFSLGIGYWLLNSRKICLPTKLLTFPWLLVLSEVAVLAIPFWQLERSVSWQSLCSLPSRRPYGAGSTLRYDMLSAFCPRPLCHPKRNLPHVNPGEAWFHYQHKFDCRRSVFGNFAPRDTFNFSLVIGYWLLNSRKICLPTKLLTFLWVLAIPYW